MTTMWCKTSKRGLMQQDILTTQWRMSVKGRQRALGDMKEGVGIWITFANLEPSSISFRYT